MHHALGPPEGRRQAMVIDCWESAALK